MSGEIIYKNHNQEIRSLPLEKHSDFSIFVKSNIRELKWARFYINNLMVDEYNNLGNFDFKNIEMHFPSTLRNNQFTIISKWNIEKFIDFVSKHLSHQITDFWQNPESFSLKDVNITLLDDSGKVAATSLNGFNTLKPHLPSDILIVHTEYLEKEFHKISQTFLNEKQQKELMDIDQFTMLNVGI